MAVREGYVVDFRPIGLTYEERKLARIGCQHCVNIAMFYSPRHGPICGSHFEGEEFNLINNRPVWIPPPKKKMKETA